MYLPQIETRHPFLIFIFVLFVSLLFFLFLPPKTKSMLEDCKLNVSNGEVICGTICREASLMVFSGIQKDDTPLIISLSPLKEGEKIKLKDERLKNVDCSREINLILVCEVPENETTTNVKCVA
jgi:hypothetical protein